MTRDIQDRFNLFAPEAEIDVQRLALNMDQIKKYNPPPNYAKPTDARSNAYRAEFGDECWELDALDPKVIRQLIVDAIHGIRNLTRWMIVDKKQKAERAQIQKVSDRWDEVVEQI